MKKIKRKEWSDLKKLFDPPLELSVSRSSEVKKVTWEDFEEMLAEG